MTGAGFPEWNSLTPKTGTVKWALIPIDFPDVPGEKNFRPRVDEQMLLLSEWFANASGGRLKVEWVVLDKWATVPGKSTDYVIPRSANVNDAPNGPKLFREAMRAADPIFDFSNIQTVNFILPSGQSFLGESSQGFPWDAVVKEVTTNEGKVSSYSIAGQFFDQPGRAYWSYWAHEFGHAIGLPHIGTNSGQPPFNAWDLMGSQDGPSRDLSGWLRFIAGWLSNDQVYCKDAMKVQSLTVTLVPVSSNDPGVKLAVLPISKTKALLIESRRESKFSCRTSPRQDGVLVYVYDATLGHFQDFLMPATPSGRQNSSTSCNAPPSLDSLLRVGDKVLIEGLTIEVLKSEKFDKVSITRS
jgi:M6 family metalloprotease-like protein